MKILLDFTLLSLSTLSFAKTSTVTCKITEKFNGKEAEVKVEFLVSDLEKQTPI